nr:hypothetical protein [Tanacetum cinerariifolium]
MSDSEHSIVTYTSISSDDLSLDVGSPGVIVYIYDGLPMMPDDPYAYVQDAMQEPPPPDFVPEPVYPEFMPPEDDVLPTEEQPLPAAVSPTADLPVYITESDPEKDSEEEDDEDPEEDPAYYHTDRDDDEEEEDESFGGDANDEEEDEGEKEEEHLALADSAEVDRLLAIPTPPSLLTLLSSPLPRIPSPPFSVPSPPTTSPTYTKAPLGYRAVEIRLRTSSPPPLPLSSPLPLPPLIILPRTRASMVMMRAAASSTYCLSSPSRTPPLLPIPLHTSSPPLLLPSTDCRADVFKVALPPQKRLCISLGPRYEIGESSSAPTARSTRGFRADYGFVGTLDVEIRRDPDKEIDFVTTVRQDTDEFYVRLDDAQDDRLVMSGQLNLLRRDRARTARLIESEARISREAWAQSMDASDTTTGTARRGTDSAEDIADSNGMADALAEHEIQRNNNLIGDGSQGSGSRITRPMRPTRECTYTDFLKCQPMNFKGTEEVFGLAQWFERMETIFNISNCAVENQVKFATCTLYGVALTWWKSHIKTVGHAATYGVPWNKLMKMMTTKYCPRNEIKKLEIKIWELKTENKRKQDDNQQQLNKRRNTSKASVGPSEKRKYGGSLPKCSKYNYHHNGPCAPKCHKCNKVGYLARDCRNSGNANTGNNQRTTGANQRGGNGSAPTKVYMVDNAGTNPDSNIITGTFLLNNCYASILFDTGADMSFVSTEFGSQIDITPTAYDYYYDVELADEKIIGINTIIRGCTLNLLKHPFNVDLMPVELDSFKVIIGRDWLAKYHVVIVCAEKIVHIP